MLCTRFFIFLCIFKCIYIDLTSAVCTVSKSKDGVGNWVKCSNTSVKDVLVPGGPFVSAITISHSNLPSLEANSFTKYSKSLTRLDIQSCNIFNIHPNTFMDLKYLKKLSLSHNKITQLHTDVFKDLISLEQLNLEFNSIKYIGNVLAKLPKLKLLNLDDNQLTCLIPDEIQALNNLVQIRILENPLTLLCRGRLTLWLKDHGINYSNESPTKKENWLDGLLWRCAIQDPVIATSENEMRQCVIFQMFNQFKSALQSTSDYSVDDGICNNEIIQFISSIQGNNAQKQMKNRQAIEIMLYALRMVHYNGNHK